MRVVAHSLPILKVLSPENQKQRCVLASLRPNRGSPRFEGGMYGSKGQGHRTDSLSGARRSKKLEYKSQLYIRDFVATWPELRRK